MKDREIIFLIGALYRGGAELHLVRIASKLIQKGWSARIFCFSRPGELAELAEESGVPVISPPIELRSSMPLMVRAPLLLLSMVKLVGLLTFRKPFAVHLFLPAAYWIGAPLLLLTRTPRRLMSRRSRNHYLQRNALARWWERFLHRQMTLLLGNSKRVVDDLIDEGADPARVRLIYNGVEAPLFSDRLAVRSAVRAKLELGSGLVLCCVANLIHYKGHADLIDAVILAKPLLPSDWSLLLVGRDDGLGSEMQRRAEKGGVGQHVKFLGGRNDVPELLAASDLFILPSHEEGFSNALLEAMAAGLPVIATDVGGNAEAVVNGETGIIVPPRRPDLLAAAILEYAQSPESRKVMGEAAMARSAAEFSLEACIEHYHAVYRSLM